MLTLQGCSTDFEALERMRNASRADLMNLEEIALRYVDCEFPSPDTNRRIRWVADEARRILDKQVADACAISAEG